MPVNAEDWLRSLPTVLSRQRAVIGRLLEHARSDERVRLFVVGCSIGRGAADKFSDVDTLVGVRERTFDDMVRSSTELVRAGGEVLDMFQQIIAPTSPDERRSQHTYAHYMDGVELDLALAIARETQQPRPDWVVLYDPDETVRGEALSKAASTDDVRAWGFNCLVRLHACTKYLTRGSLWEAHLMLERARADYWSVWATSETVADPMYGLTAVLDDPRMPMPADIAQTVALLDRSALAHAALALLDLLLAARPGAEAALSETPTAPAPLATHVRAELRKLSG